MKLGIPRESRPGETRVAASPEIVKKLHKKGIESVIEAGCGERAGFPDALYRDAGAEVGDRAAALGCEIVFKVHPPTTEEIACFKRGALLLSLMEPYLPSNSIAALAQAGVDAIAMELVPRTSRAQSMDVLSSQAGIAGYRAVIEAASHYGSFFPMMMTSAGSSKPVKLAVLGAGVAGLQAIATAKRLGASVEGYDVRKEAREQILSLGAKILEIDVGEEGAGSGGYAKELSEEGKRKQIAALSEKLKKFDVIISTANIPGKKSPTLITEEAVKGMKAGSIIVDMAAANGGNCPLTEAGKNSQKHGVTLIGVTNFPALVPTDASQFYGRNLANLLELIVQSKEGVVKLVMNLEDDILAAALVTQGGQIRKKGTS